MSMHRRDHRAFEELTEEWVELSAKIAKARKNSAGAVMLLLLALCPSDGFALSSREA